MLAVAAPRTDPVQRTVRGLCVGAFAAATAIAGHLVAMPDDAPTVGMLAFLMGVCAVVGVVAGSLPRSAEHPLALLLVVASAQLIGHLALSVGSMHPLGLPSTTMTVAHLLAAAIGACVIIGADRAARRVLGRLHRLLHDDCPSTAPAALLWRLIVSDEPLVARSGATRRHVRRGPPALPRPASL